MCGACGDQEGVDDVSVDNEHGCAEVSFDGAGLVCGAVVDGVDSEGLQVARGVRRPVMERTAEKI